MNLTVTVDSQPNPNGVGQVAVARGQYEDRIAFSLRADRTIRSGVSSALVELRQLNLSTGVPQVVFTYFSGGAHCCMQTMIVTRDPSGKWHSVDGGALDGDGGYEFINLDSTGGNLLVSLDNSFLYAFACYACSFAPTSIKRLVGAELLDVTRNPKYLTFLRERLQQMEARARSAGNTLHSNGFLGGWVAAKALVGELEDAWRTMLFSYDHNSGWLMEECLAAFPLQQCPAGKKRRIDFPEALAKHLFKNGYVTAEQKEQLIAWANRGQPAPPASSVAASKVAVVTALQNQMRPGEQRTFYNTVIAGSYALQSWGNANEGGEALLKYDPSSNHWNLVTWGGGAWDAVGLIQEGVPPDAAAALVAGVPGREAWIARERACAAEWKADKAAGKISDGMKWPQYYSDCYKRKKAEGL
jgi:hypothetical protein